MSSSAEQQAVNAGIWAGMGSTLEQVLWYQTLLVGSQMFLLCAGISQTRKYLQLFGRTDPWYYVAGVIFTLPVITAVAGANIALTYMFIFYGRDDYTSFHRFDAFNSIVSAIVGGLIGTAATSYCSWKVWKLSGKNKWMAGALVMANIIRTGFIVPVAVFGFNYPWYTLTRTDGAAYVAYHARLGLVYSLWVYCLVPCEIFICAAMMILLLMKRSTAFNRTQTLVNKLITISMRSMLPPTIALLVITGWAVEAQRGDRSNNRKLHLDGVSSYLYWVCLLFSLLSRDSVRRLLDDRRISGVAGADGTGMRIGDLRTGGPSEFRSGIFGTGSGSRQATKAFDPERSEEVMTIKTTFVDYSPAPVEGTYRLQSVNRDAIPILTDSNGDLASRPPTPPFSHWPEATEVAEDWKAEDEGSDKLEVV